MKKRDRIAELRIDREIACRTEHVYVYHITGISRKINGITVVTTSPYQYDMILAHIVAVSYRLDKEYNDVFPGDLKMAFNTMHLGIAICDHRDQFDHNIGRVKAKRAWLRLNPRKS